MAYIPAKEVDTMLTGKLNGLLDLLQQRHLPNTRLVPDQIDSGYGFAADAEGRDVLLSHDVARNRFGFDDRRIGKQAVDPTKRVHR